MSGNPSLAYNDNGSLNSLSATTNGIYSINYQSASNGQTLTVTFSMVSGPSASSEVYLQAALMLATPIQGQIPKTPPVGSSAGEASVAFNQVQRALASGYSAIALTMAEDSYITVARQPTNLATYNGAINIMLLAWQKLSSTTALLTIPNRSTD
jgi:hypothetical protein